MPEIVFKLHGGPWDGQTIDSSASCEITADFARVLFTTTRGAAVGQELRLASPADSELREEVGDASDASPDLRSHTYAITERSQSKGAVIATAVHIGA